LYRDTGIADEMEVLYSLPNLKVRRFRMKKTQRLDDLDAGPNESVITVAAGSVELKESKNGNVFSLDWHDVCYLPPNDVFSIRKLSDNCEVLWASAPASVHIEPYRKKLADCKKTEYGSKDDPSGYRVSTSLINRFDKRERLSMGYTVVEAGRWAGFPPHRHDGIPEVYIFSGMGRGFAIQMVWDGDGEKAYIVKDGDSVGFNEGYHPNVADPKVELKFFWVLSSDPKHPMRTPDGGFAPIIHPDYQEMK
jgi:5-deoxy-D-glucuronate isomerase